MSCVLLACLHFILVLYLDCKLPPLPKETCHVLHTMISVEKSSHSIEKILIAMQVLFFLDKLELEAGTYGFILQRVVVLNVVNQFF